MMFEEMSFDFAKWQEEGRLALKKVEERIAINEAERKELETAKAGLLASLGGVGKDGERKRVRIRPMLKKVLITMNMDGTPPSQKELVSKVRDQLPVVSEESVVASLKQWMKDDPNVLSENGVFVYKRS